MENKIPEFPKVFTEEDEQLLAQVTAEKKAMQEAYGLTLLLMRGLRSLQSKRRRGILSSRWLTLFLPLVAGSPRLPRGKLMRDGMSWKRNTIDLIDFA